MMNTYLLSKDLESVSDGYTFYNAGLPHFPRSFTRDAVLSAMICNDPMMLRDQLRFSSAHQGNKKDPYTGEEPGKVYHEFPGVVIDGLSTEFNACDTTALYLIGLDRYEQMTGDVSLREAHKDNIERAVNYVLSHVENGFFMESPAFCDAKRFALRVTYWKDSQIPSREDGQPAYPVVYFLAQVQNLAALRSASRLVKAGSDLAKIAASTAEEMTANLHKLYDEDRKTFYIAVDQQGPIRGVTSDLVHALFYLEKGDVPQDIMENIVKTTNVLETRAGYITMDDFTAKTMTDKYHANTVWPFEQAVIHIGAKKFDLDHIAEVSSRVMDFLDTDPEILIVDGDNISKGGCDPQLWTIAAKLYFQKERARI